LSTRVVKAPRGGNESQSASESSESPAVRHATPLIKKKKNARFRARAQIEGVTRDRVTKEAQLDLEIIMFRALQRDVPPLLHTPHKFRFRFWYLKHTRPAVQLLLV
jgi:hypothetical protein